MADPDSSARPAPGPAEAPSVSPRRYGGQTGEERRAARRERLLDAGLELFGTGGFSATTIEALCRQAGLNPRYFYEQFRSREELLQAVYDRHVDGVLATVVAAIAHAPADPRARLERGLRAFIDGTLADRRAAQINYFEVVGVSVELEARRRAVLRSYAEMIAGQAAELGAPAFLTTANPDLAATALVSATDGLLIDMLSRARAPERCPVAEDAEVAEVAEDAEDAERDRILTTLLAIFAPVSPGG